VINAAVDHAVDTLRLAPGSAQMFVRVPPDSASHTDQPLSGSLRGRVAQLVDALTQGEMTSLALTRRAVDRAEAWPGVISDLEQVSPLALESAADVDHRRGKGEHLGALAGLPVTVKDNVDVAGLVSGQGGSLGRHQAITDSGAWSRLNVEGSVLIGHTSMHELAWGLTTPGCPNPWGAGLTPGGSSGGAAASVAAGIVSIAIGTDTGGSIRVPAALCGVAGLRPTHGVSAMRGIAPLAPSLDTVGALAQTAADCVLAHELMSRPGKAAPDQLDGLRVGVLAGWQGRVSDGVATAMDDACAVLRAHGVQIAELEIAHARLAPSVAYVLMLIESSRLWLSEAERRSTDVRPDVLEQLREGGRIDVPGGPYGLARALARTLRAHAERALWSNQLAAFISPVIAATGVREEASAVTVQGRAMATTDALSRYTALASVTGLPALSVPAGLESGSPVAIQLIGAPYDERLLALLARPIEQGPGLIVAAERGTLRPF
jgi:Asp-tRNA(Asn)/Glu-tRNA(Gln) amidotransferase A subunit family amidase